MLHFYKKAGLISGLFPCYENSIYTRKEQAPWIVEVRLRMPRPVATPNSPASGRLSFGPPSGWELDSENANILYISIIQK
ncbi:hypothetical protein D7Z54_22005 [Salibacterium salarium]|uniref:Uncharacterized protein n=1 Tax=Salibacterium salarium TaxID=284579 RepID=A0A428MYG9_9BACI|nr:hypothetical protein D7Z54_22005 [Salibacterium salarium]